MKDPVCSSVGKFCYHKKLINFCENNVKKAIGHTGTQEVEGQNPSNPTQATRMAAGSYIKLEVYDRLYRVYFYFIFLLLRLMNLPFVEKDIKNHTIFHDNICSVSQRYSLLKNTDRIVLPRSSATR